ncbi:MAG: sigma-70 family RNA polymerase sigma factor [Saprospiraceae bacterium]|nr:sigma-70 family RNA polymerase sigma factor [Saprospiraceae bacterium]
MMTDSELMAKVKQGELRFMSDIFNRHHVSIYNYFKKMTGRPSLSEDLTQTVFEKVIRSKHAYNEQSAFKAWLFKMAKNSLMDHYRSNKKMQITYDKIPEQVSFYDDDSEKLDPDLKAKVHNALKRIKHEHKEILILTRFENLQYAEAAAVVGISENAVKARVFRAIKSFKEAYYNS